MTTEIKEYKQLTTIELFDGEVKTMATIKQLTPLLNKNKFIEIGGELIATHQIRRCFVSKIDTIEGFILSQEKEIQAKLRLREKEKIGRVGKGFRDVEEIQGYINEYII